MTRLFVWLVALVLSAGILLTFHTADWVWAVAGVGITLLLAAAFTPALMKDNKK